MEEKKKKKIFTLDHRGLRWLKRKSKKGATDESAVVAASSAAVETPAEAATVKPVVSSSEDKAATSSEIEETLPKPITYKSVEPHLGIETEAPVPGDQNLKLSGILEKGTQERSLAAILGDVESNESEEIIIHHQSKDIELNEENIRSLKSGPLDDYALSYMGKRLVEPYSESKVFFTDVFTTLNITNGNYSAGKMKQFLKNNNHPTVLFLPVFIQTARGSHQILLVCDFRKADSPVFHHYETRNAPEPDYKAVVKKTIEDTVGNILTYTNQSNKKVANINFHQCPKQLSADECGVRIAVMAETISEEISKNKDYRIGDITRIRSLDPVRKETLGAYSNQQKNIQNDEVTVEPSTIHIVKDTTENPISHDLPKLEEVTPKKSLEGATVDDQVIDDVQKTPTDEPAVTDTALGNETPHPVEREATQTIVDQLYGFGAQLFETVAGAAGSVILPFGRGQVPLPERSLADFKQLAEHEQAKHDPRSSTERHRDDHGLEQTSPQTITPTVTPVASPVVAESSKRESETVEENAADISKYDRADIEFVDRFKSATRGRFRVDKKDESSITGQTVLTILRRTEDKDPSSKKIHKPFEIAIAQGTPGLDTIEKNRHIYISKRAGAYVGMTGNEFYISGIQPKLTRQKSISQIQKEKQEGSAPPSPRSRKGSFSK